jgi:pyrimidine-nucleoside phosphorylase
MLAHRLIERKRDGNRIDPGEWRALALAYARGHVPDYQMAALLMACFLRGLDRAETAALTDALLLSGATLQLADLGRPRIDKHSTGGVGDKTSLILAPLIASLGVAVPMMSGRGLGHTGGTLDKLESIPGFRTALSLAEAEKQIARIGCAMLSQTDEIVPADRRIYALRDATATVEVIPLIAASIMSKKIAESLTGLVLDVKRGSGSFLPELDDEVELAMAMIDLGARHGCPVVALVTAMDRPLGYACGNALEMAEAIDVLKGDGPPDLNEVTLALGAEMLLLAAAATTMETAHAQMKDALASGRALLKLEEIVSAQGGDAGVIRDPARLPRALHQATFEAKRDGVVESVDPRAIGYGVIALGGGRTNMEERVDPSVGFVITAKPGHHVAKGQPLATIHARSREDLALGRSTLERAIVIADSAPSPLPLVSHRVTVRGVERLD